MRRLGLLALLAIAALGAAATWLDSQISKPYRGHRPEKVFVDIPHGTSRWEIAGLLKRQDIIRNRLAFELLSLWHFRRPLQAGEYLIDHQMDSRQVFWMISSGRIFVRTVTIPEGWTMFDIAAELERQGVCNREKFLSVARDPSPISDLAPRAHSLEGFLFPSTYEVAGHTTCEQVAASMVRQFRSAWDILDPSHQLKFPQGLSLEEVVSLASLVERETPNPAERPLVAGVFYNRLDRGFPLQCDPTVQYALALDGHSRKNVRPQDLRIDSAYNTYLHRGLPPGPIANPGMASLRAALSPAQTDYMYFVANDQGGHFFSKTLAEHNRNVERYRQLLEDNANSSDPDGVKSKHRGKS
jgi:UPF0755 protein